MTTERERLLHKIKRVQALAENGVGGEKESAAAMLETLMIRYDITEDDISAERKELAWFRYKTDIERRLLGQIIYAVTGENAGQAVGRFSGKQRKELGIECTAADRLEIKISFDFFNAAMQDEFNRFYTAFIHKNGIFPSYSNEDMTEPSEISKDEILKIAAMMEGMDTHIRQRLIESGDN